MTDKMREDFEAWFVGKDADIIMRSMVEINKNGSYVYQSAKDSWIVWQAATAESTAKIELMQARIDELVESLESILSASTKLQAENIATEALAKVKDEK